MKTRLTESRHQRIEFIAKYYEKRISIISRWARQLASPERMEMVKSNGVHPYVFRTMVDYTRYREAATIIMELSLRNISISGLRVLDFGCLVSDFGLMLARKGAIVSIYDHDKEALNFAEARYIAENLPVMKIPSDAPHIDIIGGQDLVVFGEVLEHLFDPYSLLHQCSTAKIKYIYSSCYPFGDQAYFDHSGHRKSAQEQQQQCISLLRDNYEEVDLGRKAHLWITPKEIDYKITLAYTYYGQREMAEIHREAWLRHKVPIRYNIVDDGSPTPLTEFEYPNLKIHRVTVDIPWNIAGARNLAVMTASTEWVLLCDVDHVVSAEALDKIAELDLSDPDIVYIFPRVNAAGEYGVDAYMNILINRTKYLEIGGFDEDFKSYGKEDVFFYHMLIANNLKIVKTDIVLNWYYRLGKTYGLARDNANASLLTSKLEHLRSGTYQKGDILRFPWVEASGAWK